MIWIYCLATIGVLTLLSLFVITIIYTVGLVSMIKDHEAILFEVLKSDANNLKSVDDLKYKHSDVNARLNRLEAWKIYKESKKK